MQRQSLSDEAGPAKGGTGVLSGDEKKLPTAKD